MHRTLLLASLTILILGLPLPERSPQDSTRPANIATPAPASRREEAPPPTRARPATLAPPRLDLVFGDALATGIDASLVGDRSPLPV